MGILNASLTPHTGNGGSIFIDPAQSTMQIRDLSAQILGMGIELSQRGTGVFLSVSPPL